MESRALRLDPLFCEVHMRQVGSLVAVLVVAAVVGFLYKSYLQNQQAAPIAHPRQTIDVIGVQNDLLGIAQAERMYQTEHNSYGSLDDLASSGAMNMKKSGRDGYTYEAAEVSADSFRIVAHCPSETVPGCANYAIDQTMQVVIAP
jgi:hypothetical protein